MYRITSLHNDGKGSLRECVEGRGPRVCVFEVSGVIRLRDEIRVEHPYLTVAGQTAPAPGIILRGAGMSVEASEVIIQHLYFRVGDDPRAPCCEEGTCPKSDGSQYCAHDPSTRDGLRVYASNGPIDNVLIDHVSISWALDEGFSISTAAGPVSNVTFGNSIVSAGLHRSLHPERHDSTSPGHSYGALLTGNHELVGCTIHYNLLAHNADWNFRIAVPGSIEYVNNVVYNWGRGHGEGHLIELYNDEGFIHSFDIIGNTYLPGPDSYCPSEYEPELCDDISQGLDEKKRRAAMHHILRIGSGVSGGLRGQSRYYLKDNWGPTRRSPHQSEWDIADDSFYSDFESRSLRFPQNRALLPVAASGGIEVHLAPIAVDRVLSQVGARPYDRDPVDQQIVSDVRKNVGKIINCVAEDGTARCERNAGGWPRYVRQRAAIQLPSDPHGDSDNDGYTNLEEWLHLN